MNFRDLDLQKSYISYGDNNIAKSFLIPALKCAKSYKRSVGFFSSSVLEPIMDGIVALTRNKGQIQLICGPNLSEDDIAAIQAGYDGRDEIIINSFAKDFKKALEDFSEDRLRLLAELIARGTLDIKLAVTNDYGIYHDKLGILEDFDDNIIVFYGSPNSSLNAYQKNYEKIRTVNSWTKSDYECIIDERSEFDDLWSGTNEFVQTYDYKESAKKNIVQVIEERSSTSVAVDSKNEPIQLRDYQEQAIQVWVNNDYHGFYVMATGTGKTWTAIYSAKRLLEKHSAMIVICAPYKHLVKQWAEDVEKAFPKSKIILVSSENPSWPQQLKDTIIQKRYFPDTQIVVITTICSFQKERFKDVISTSSEEKLLIVDEAHRFTTRPEYLKRSYQYMLGLSATPFSGTSAAKGNELMDFFGGQVFKLTIEDALSRGHLVPYYYVPIIVDSNSEEEEKFQKLTRKIISCFTPSGRCKDPDTLIKTLRNRLRIISMAQSKLDKINGILDTVKEKDHFVVYCGDGKLFDKDLKEELRHIQKIKRVIDSFGLKTSQFTAQENMRERMPRVDAFNKGEIDSLVAIRCLDEGINIPSIKSALILSSNDDYREFVQRRGRILRKYKGKEYSIIYDVIVLPSYETPAWAKIELRRFHEYAKLALNWEQLESQLDEYLGQYDLSFEDVDVYDYDNMEDELDE